MDGSHHDFLLLIERRTYSEINLQTCLASHTVQKVTELIALQAATVSFPLNTGHWINAQIMSISVASVHDPLWTQLPN